MLSASDLAIRQVGHEDRFSVAGYDIQVYGDLHALGHPDVTPVANSGRLSAGAKGAGPRPGAVEAPRGFRQAQAYRALTCFRSSPVIRMRPSRAYQYTQAGSRPGARANSSAPIRPRA